MPIPNTIENVISPRYLNVSGGLLTSMLDPAGQQTTLPVTMEVYTGVVGFLAPDGFGGGGRVRRDEVRIFLPFEAMRVKAYSQVSFFDVTAMASVAAYRGDEDEILATVDRVVSVRLEQQAFPGVGGSHMCLVMRANLAAMNADILRYTYQVTVLVNAGAVTNDLAPLAAGTSPA
jgi:hypothetical protein